MQFEWLTSISWLNPSSLFSLRYSRQNKSSSSTWCQSLLSLNRMVVRVNENFEKRGVVWIESWLWRGYLLSSRNSSNLQFLACSCLSKSKWCIWRIVALFHLCCHYEEILNHKHNKICNMIPFASLRTQKRWLNIRWFLGPQQWFYIKNSDRTTHSGVSSCIAGCGTSWASLSTSLRAARLSSFLSKECIWKLTKFILYLSSLLLHF